MVIVEDERSLSLFLKLFDKRDSIVLPIFVDTRLHPAVNVVSCFFVRFLGEQVSDYIIPVKHNEARGLKHFWTESSGDLLSHSDRAKLTYDKKALLHAAPRIKNVVDVKMVHYFDTGIPLGLYQQETESQRQIHRNFRDR